MRRYLVCGVTLMAVAASCMHQAKNGVLPDSGWRFTTDSAEYTARPIAPSGQRERFGFRVIARFENRTSAPVYLGRCYPTSAQPLFSVAWADRPSSMPPFVGYSQVWMCVGHDQQFQIGPDAWRVDTLLVTGPNAWDG